MLTIPDKLLINLKILSKLEKNGRIARSYSGIISLESNVFYQSLKRFVSQDSRYQSIQEIRSIIDDTESKINSLLDSKYLRSVVNTDYIRVCEILNLLLTELPGTITGLENLRFTYKADVYTESQIDIILIKVRSVFKNLDSRLPQFISKIPDGKLPDNLVFDLTPSIQLGTGASDAESEESDLRPKNF